MKYPVRVIIAAFCCFAPQAFAQRHGPHKISAAPIASDVRSEARRLASAWVQTAGAHTLDDLSRRAIAFAGMVPHIDVVLDGHRLSANQVLCDSALTILGPHTDAEDAAAARNIVYALMEISKGHAFRSDRP